MTKLLNLLNSKPKTAKQIILKLGISGYKLRQIVHNLRIDGHKIISGQKGYYISNDNEKIRACANSLIRRGMSIVKAGKSMLK